MSIIGILIAIIIIGVLLWATRSLITAFSIPNPIATIIYVVVVILILIWFLNQVGFNTGLRLT
jgi:high-affinity K+ transport system ATPase subunit B